MSYCYFFKKKSKVLFICMYLFYIYTYILLLFFQKKNLFNFFSCLSSVDTSATLKHIKELPTGIYTVPVDVTDLQGYGKTQKLTVRICQCRNGACLAKESSISLGGLALLAMLLPLALLLLLCEYSHRYILASRIV